MDKTKQQRETIVYQLFKFSGVGYVSYVSITGDNKRYE